MQILYNTSIYLYTLQCILLLKNCFHTHKFFRSQLFKIFCRISFAWKQKLYKGTYSSTKVTALPSTTSTTPTSCIGILYSRNWFMNNIDILCSILPYHDIAAFLLILCWFWVGALWAKVHNIKDQPRYFQIYLKTLNIHFNESS